MKKKLPYLDQFQSIDDAFNYLVKELNATRVKSGSSGQVSGSTSDYTGMPIGSIVHSMLTEAQMVTQAGSGWILADGRSVSGSSYNSITGLANCPDMRGRFIRGKSHGSGNNPDGDLGLGAYTGDKIGAHDHTLTNGYGHVLYKNAGGGAATVSMPSGGNFQDELKTTAVGSNETAPKSITVNIFIRIN